MDKQYPVKLKWVEETNDEDGSIFRLDFEGLNGPALANIYTYKDKEEAGAEFRARLFTYENQSGTDCFYDVGEMEDFKSLDEALAWVESKLGLGSAE